MNIACTTTREAIRRATKDARECAAQRGTDWTEPVILPSGDTLYVTAQPDGTVCQRVEAGWPLRGGVYGTRRTLGIAR